MKPLLPLAQLTLTLLLMAASVGLLSVPGLRSLEQQLDDWRINLFLTNQVNTDVVIVDIDEPSLQQLGQWPWSRQILADLLQQLHEHYQVRVTGLDLVMAEAQRVSAVDLLALQQLGVLTLTQPIDQLPALSPQDQALSEIIAQHPIVPGYLFKTDSALLLNELPEPVLRLTDEQQQQIDLIEAKGYSANVPVLSRAAGNQGFFDNPVVDSDGVYRRAALVQRYADGIYPSLSLAVLQRLVSGDSNELAPLSLQFEQRADQWVLDHVQLGRLLIPTGVAGTVRVPFHHRDRGFPYVSAVDVLQGKVAPEVLQQKIVLVGTTAPGLKDIRTTAVNAQTPGVEIHANLIAGFLQQRIAHQPDWRLAVELMQLALVLILLNWLYRSQRPILEMAGTLILLSINIGINGYFWSQGLLLSLAPVMVQVAGLYLLTSSWQLLSEYYGRKKVVRLFGQYVPPDVVGELQNVASDALLRGEEKQLTVLFSDVRGFTTISESLDPEQLSGLMNRLLTPLTQVIHGSQGTIDKYMGDAIMAFWGAPLAQPDHANRAVAAALNMQQQLQTLSASLQDMQVGELGMGIGISTGPMCVGNMGSQFRMAYTVMGDAVNLGARLEALTRQYGVDILVSDVTAQAADEFVFLPVDRVRVKGKTEPVSILTPLCHQSLRNDAGDRLIDTMKAALSAYQMQQWQEAAEHFAHLAALDSRFSFLGEVYQNRIVQLQQTELPESWDGVFTFTSK